TGQAHRRDDAQVPRRPAGGAQDLDHPHAGEEVESAAEGGAMLRIITGALGALISMSAVAQVPALPKSPVTLNVVDVAGNLALTQDAIENYRAKHPNLVSRITFTKAPAPELPGKLKAQQGAKRVDIDLVLTGTDALAAGIEKGLWTPILPTYAAKFPNLMLNYQEPAAKMQELAQNQGVLVTFMPAGPLLEFNPDK